MARVVPAHEVGLPEGAGRVRISSSKARRGKILAVEHPVFGWVKYREWALLGYLERVLEKIGPIELVAWVGLTFTLAESVKTSAQFVSFLVNAGISISDAFQNIFLPSEEGLGAFLNPIGALLGTMQPGTQESPRVGLEGVVGAFARYAYAALGAAILILTLKRV